MLDILNQHEEQICPGVRRRVQIHDCAGLILWRAHACACVGVGARVGVLDMLRAYVDVCVLPRTSRAETP